MRCGLFDLVANGVANMIAPERIELERRRVEVEGVVRKVRESRCISVGIVLCLKTISDIQYFVWRIVRDDARSLTVADPYGLCILFSQLLPHEEGLRNSALCEILVFLLECRAFPPDTITPLVEHVLADLENETNSMIFSFMCSFYSCDDFVVHALRLTGVYLVRACCGFIDAGIAIHAHIRELVYRLVTVGGETKFVAIRAINLPPDQMHAYGVYRVIMRDTRSECRLLRDSAYSFASQCIHNNGRVSRELLGFVMASMAEGTVTEKSEAIMFISKIVAYVDINDLSELVDCGLAQCLCDILQCYDKRVISSALSVLAALYRAYGCELRTVITPDMFDGISALSEECPDAAFLVSQLVME